MSSWSGGGKPKKKSAGGWSSPQSGGPSSEGPSWRQAAAPGGRASARREWQWGLYALLGVALLGVLLWVILPRKDQTPVLVVAGLDYLSPAPPNQGALEDFDALNELGDQGLGTLSFDKVEGDWLGNDAQAWSEFGQKLAVHNRLRRGLLKIEEPVVVYFSMPGVVNKRGEPCLLPPGASPLSDENWRSVDAVVKQIAASVPDERNKLLILDANQQHVNWRLGLVRNTFVERLRQYVEGCGVPNLAVLTAADAGQRSWASPHLGGTAFGQFLRLGIAGEADHRSSESDNRVTLSELAGYLEDEVDAWARANRNAAQTPTLITSTGGVDFFVAHALDERQVAPLRDRLEEAAEAKPAIPLTELQALWEQFGSLLEHDAVRYDPLAVSLYRQRLMRLERLAYGGRAYSESTQAAAALGEELASAVERAKAAGPALADRWAVTSPQQVGTARYPSNLHSVPLRAYFGQGDTADGKRVANLWKHLTTLATATGQQDPAALKTAVEETDLELEETQLLVAAIQQRIRDLGKKSSDVNQAFQLRGLAERLSVPSTDAGVPGDERAHYYVRRAMAESEQLRREAEDRLFVRRTAGDQSARLISDAKRGYSQVARLRDRLTTAFAQVDRGLADLPYLAEWLDQAGDEEELEELRTVIDEVKRLGDGIGRLAGLERDTEGLFEWAEQLAAQAESVQSRTDKLRDRFQAACEALGRAEDGREVANIELALRSPLVTPKQRTRLLKAREEISRDVQGQYFNPTGPIAKANAGEGEQAAIEKSVEKWSGRSPLLDLLSLDPAADGEGELARAEAACWAVRNELADLVAMQSPRAAIDNDSDTPPSLQERQALSTAARRTRAAAALLPRVPGEDPIAELRRFDLQQLLFWHAERALDGFWHTVTGVAPKTIDDLRTGPRVGAIASRGPYFQLAAENYLRIAEKVDSVDRPGVALQMQAMHALVEDRLLASKRGLGLVTEPRPVAGDAKAFDIRVRVEGGPDDAPLPDGLAAVYLADRSQTRIDADGGSLGSALVPVEPGQSRQLTARAAKTEGLGDSLYAVAFFRGQRYRRPFEPPNPGGAVVGYAWPRYDGQSIRLYGDDPSPPSVAFILDCSRSMKTRISSEGGRRERLDVAKQALDEMLGELEKRGEKRSGPKPRVGVWFFGHRLTWGRDNPIEYFNPLGLPSPPRSITPANDIECMLPIGLFGPEEYGEVQRRLDALRPLGFTPVLLSIIQALEAFDEDDQNAKSIIVITDGKNDQQFRTGFRGTPTTVSEVIRAWNRINNGLPESRRIEIYIVGFGIAESDREAVEQLKSVPDATAGDWVRIEEGRNLLPYLQNRLSANGYTVVRSDGQPLHTDSVSGDAQKFALNTAVDAPTRLLSRLPAEVDLEFQRLTKRVALEGGEALELRLRGGDMQAVPYNKNVGARALMVDASGATASRLRFRAHTPKRNKANQVRFRFSVQDEDAHFTPRPKMVWVEATPPGKKTAYVFYDRVFAPQTPTPVVEFTASNWPEGVDEARVRFWCSDEPPRASQVVPLSSVVGRDPNEPSLRDDPLGVKVGVSLAGLSDTDEFVVTVEERHAEGAPLRGVLRVWLEAENPSLTPSRVEHLYERRLGLVRHRYFYPRDRKSEEGFAKDLSVHWASGESIKQDALRLEDEAGLLVRIIDEEGGLAPTPIDALP